MAENKSVCASMSLALQNNKKTSLKTLSKFLAKPGELDLNPEAALACEKPWQGSSVGSPTQPTSDSLPSLTKESFKITFVLFFCSAGQGESAQIADIHSLCISWRS